MLTVEDFTDIRQAKRDGMSIRAIARPFRRSRKSIRKALADPEPAPYTLSEPRAAPKLGPYPDVQVPLPKLDQFNQLLTTGAFDHG